MMFQNEQLSLASDRFLTSLAVFLLMTLVFNVCRADADTKLWSFRGGSGIGPENTLEAMDLAFDFGAAGTEIDIWHAGVTIGPSVEPEIMVHHDRSVSRTTNGVGNIQDLSPAYLRTLDAGSSNGTTRFPGAKVPTFDEALSLLKTRDKDLLLHIKTSPFGEPGTVPSTVIASALAEADFPEDNLYTWSSVPERIEDYVSEISGIQVIYQGNIDPETVVWQEIIDLGVKGIQIPFDQQMNGGGKFNQSYIDDIQSNGLFSFVIWPSEREFRNAIDWGVDIVMTHKVDRYSVILDELTNDFTQGDYNHDGTTDGADVNLYIGNLDQPAIGTLAKLDLDNDGDVTLADHDLHVTTLAKTSNGITGALLGDVNLDGSVDVVNDAFALIENLGKSTVQPEDTDYDGDPGNLEDLFAFIGKIETVSRRAQGDLNADGVVNVLDDGFLLVRDLGRSNGSAFPLSTTAVPEPGRFYFLSVFGLALACRRKR